MTTKGNLNREIHHMEILEFKRTVTQMENLLDRLGSRLETTEGKPRESEDRLIELSRPQNRETIEEKSKELKKDV